MSIEERLPAGHLLWRIRKLADQAIGLLNLPFFNWNATDDPPSVKSEHMLLASQLLAFYEIRPERLLRVQLHYNLLFRWFCGPESCTCAANRSWPTMCC